MEVSMLGKITFGQFGDGISCGVLPSAELPTVCSAFSPKVQGFL